MYRPEILPEESAGSYLRDLCLVNGFRTPMEAVSATIREFGFSLRCKKFPMPALAAACGLSHTEFRNFHTLLPFESAFNKFLMSRLDEAGWGQVSSLGRFCNHCVEESVIRFGRPFLNRRHQLPGIYWCAQHEFQTLLGENPKHAPRAAQAFGATSLRFAAMPEHEQAFLRRYMRLANALLDLRFEPAGVLKWLRPDRRSKDHANDSPKTSPLLSDELFQAPQDWLLSMYPGWVKKRRCQPLGALDLSAGRAPTALVCAVLVCRLVTDEKLDDFLSSPFMVH